MAAAWLFVILSGSYDLTTRSWDLSARHIIGRQDFWFTLFITVL
jgi:hypothetical protein